MQGKKTSHIWSPPPKAYKDFPFSFLFFWLGGQIQNRILSPEYCPEKHKEKWVHKMQEKKSTYIVEDICGGSNQQGDLITEVQNGILSPEYCPEKHK